MKSWKTLREKDQSRAERKKNPLTVLFFQSHNFKINLYVYELWLMIFDVVKQSQKASSMELMIDSQNVPWLTQKGLRHKP